MKYYWLKSSIDIKEVGKYPQNEETKSLGTIQDIDYNQFIIKGLIPPEPIIESKAKLTTYLECISISHLKFLTIKKNFVAFLQNFLIGDFQTWDMRVQYRDKTITDYALFHLSYPSQEKYIDYVNSEFYIGNIRDYKYVGEILNISGYQNFLSTREVLRKEKLMLKSTKLIFDLKQVKEDLFRITDTVSVIGALGYYVSDRLREAIIKEGFTGMKFTEISELSPKIEVIY